MTTYLEPKLPEAGLAGSYISGAWHWPENGPKPFAGRTVSLDYVRLSAAVPEPSGALLVGLAGCSLLLRRRR